MVLVALDFDGELSQINLSVLLGREYDVAGEMRRIVEQGLRGEVDFPTMLRHRVSLLEGMPEDRVTRAFDRCKLQEGGGERPRRGPQSVGGVHADITGSFERGVRSTLDRAGISVDHIVANRLVLENGAVTGEVEGPLMDGDKGAALEEIKAELQDELGYQPTNPEVIGILMARYGAGTDGSDAGLASVSRSTMRTTSQTD